MEVIPLDSFSSPFPNLESSASSQVATNPQLVWAMIAEDMLKPFLKSSEDITEQGRIYKTYGKETWQKLREIAKTR